MEIKNMDSTNYYNANASGYIADTFNSNMSEIRNRFISSLSYLQGRCHSVTEGAGVVTILDAGCGSGRDSKAFKESGFDVHAMDASESMVEHCRTIIGDRCRLATFQEYHTEVKFDGIWACASLLHLKPEELDAVLKKFTRFLKPGGVFFMSFKYGEKDYIKDGRYFNCHTSETVTELLNTLEEAEIIENFITSDVREGRSGEKWVNVIVRKDV
jgi:2-polyprenyl-3-methyl-5-hydroxy-6-metoxy-1,4-benzoquinol methylase